jgi:hypothetical protein
VHGLTDQVLTTNLGTLLLALATAALLGCLSDPAQRLLYAWARRLGLAALALLAGALVVLLALPGGRAQLLLDLGGLEMLQGFSRPPDAHDRAELLQQAEGSLQLALAQAPDHPAVLRDLALTRAARYDERAGLEALERAAASPRLDAFDRLQIAHAYRELGFAGEAYAWANAAYQAWGRPPQDAVLRVYQQATLSDANARVLADQGEAALHARDYASAQALFQQALTFQPGSAYLQERVAAAQRGLARADAG